MCVVQRSQKQKRERERKRTRRREKNARDTISFFFTFVFLLLTSSFRAYTERFSKKLSKLFCGDVSSFFLLLWSRFFKIFLESV